MSESDRFLNRKAGKTPEKSNFAQACTLLGQFLKEKRNLGVVIPGNVEIGKEKPETSSFRPPVETKNFLTNMASQGGPPSTAQTGTVTVSTMVKSSDFFQQFKGFGASTATPPPPPPPPANPNLEDSNKSDLRKSTSSVIRPETTQMTIFYGGQVLVFNDIPADKANEVMALARKGSSNISGSVSSSAAAAAAATTTVPVVMEKIDLTKPPVPEPDLSPIPKPDDDDDNNNNNNNNNNQKVNINVSDCKTNNKHESLQQRPADQAASDLPIARRNSLHRFLEKRKDRVAAKAPYQVENRRAVVEAPPKPDEGNQWSQQEGGECSDQHLELKLW